MSMDDKDPLNRGKRREKGVEGERRRTDCGPSSSKENKSIFFQLSSLEVFTPYES